MLHRDHIRGRGHHKPDHAGRVANLILTPAPERQRRSFHSGLGLDPQFSLSAVDTQYQLCVTVASGQSSRLSAPTRSRGMSRKSDPCLRKTLPALCWGLIPTPSLVMMALVWGGTLNSSAANFNTAVNGASSGTLNTLYGSLGSEVRVTLKDTFGAALFAAIVSLDGT
eukprot:TRINITY_DN1552_c0_g1_i7.p1 TRINITY_DN1552_c0_g1~~TRINITY_DN1552_c0_g1_i7.p1  ORF type:complete len:168 (+),score=5.05 TRINITY_DN1552_c0_g1_i7:443-946(+)